MVSGAGGEAGRSDAPAGVDGRAGGGRDRRRWSPAASGGWCRWWAKWMRSAFGRWWWWRRDEWKKIGECWEVNWTFGWAHRRFPVELGGPTEQ